MNDGLQLLINKGFSADRRPCPPRLARWASSDPALPRRETPEADEVEKPLPGKSLPAGHHMSETQSLLSPFISLEPREVLRLSSRKSQPVRVWAQEPGGWSFNPSTL